MLLEDVPGVVNASVSFPPVLEEGPPALPDDDSELESPVDSPSYGPPFKPHQQGLPCHKLGPKKCITRSLTARSIRGRDSRGSKSGYPLHAESSSMTLVDYEPFARTRTLPALERALLMGEDHLFRRMWSVATAIMMVYVGTIFPYRLCFVELHVGEEEFDAWPAWEVINSIVDAFFWFDLVLNFLFTVRDHKDREIFNFRVVAVKYLHGSFALNVVACLPPEFYSFLIALALDTATEGSPSSANQMPRMVQMTRISKLVRLSRLSRLLAFRKLQTLSYLLTMRGFSVLNFVLGLFWVAHLAACGWYLCAAMHDEAEQTWVGRRGLLEADPLQLWCHAVYFIMTLFTTVGFGDISASTVGEIVYVCFTMVLGTIVHSIIMSRVISAIMDHDSLQLEVFRRKEMLSHFVRHTNLSGEMTRELEGALLKNSERQVGQFDKSSMARLLQGNSLSHDLLGELPFHLFQGQLVDNTFFAICRIFSRGSISPRLTLLIAMSAHERYFEEHELVYQTLDDPWELFLVLKGCFAFVTPSEKATTKVDVVSETISVTESKSETKKKVSIVEKLAARREQGRDLHPYKLLCHQSFFGEYEVMFDVGPRKTHARCEDPQGGIALSLHKNDFADVKEEFPQYVQVWHSVAARREFRRLTLLQTATKVKAHRTLAAVTIQRFFRAQRRGSGGGMGATLKGCFDFAVRSASMTLRMPEHARQLHKQTMQLQGEMKEMQRSLETELSGIRKALSMMAEKMEDKKSR